MPLGALMLTGEQIRAGRAFLRMEQVDLAKSAGVSLETVKRLEKMRGPVEANIRTVAAIAEAFYRSGVSFDLTRGAGPGLRFLEPGEGGFASHAA